MSEVIEVKQFSGSLGLKLFLNAAKKIAGNSPRLLKLLTDSQSKLRTNSNDIREIKDSVSKLVVMIRYSMQGKYKLPVRTLISTISALLYFVNPIDFIPDFIIGAGFIDDITVFVFLLKLIKKDLQDFTNWHNRLEPKPTDIIIESPAKLEP